MFELPIILTKLSFFLLADLVYGSFSIVDSINSLLEKKIVGLLTFNCLYSCD